MPARALSRQGGSDAALPGLIDAIGTEIFGERLLRLLHEEAGADHCSGFLRSSGRVSRLTSASLDGTDTALLQGTLYLDGDYWRRDAMLTDGWGDLTAGSIRISRVAVADMPDPDLRETVYRRRSIRERVMICGTRGRTAFGLSILRSDGQGPFTGRELKRLRSRSDLLLSIVAKHADMTFDAGLSAGDLTSLERIEARVGTSPAKLPRREAEVCARILYGLSTTGIALDVGIGSESVVTYRKRAYDRLGIATRRELLLWYLLLPRAGCLAASDGRRGQAACRMLSRGHAGEA